MKKAVFLIIVLIFALSLSITLAEEWICPTCTKTNTTKFCTNCGTKHEVWICPNCGTENSDAFCGNCGTAKPVDISFLYGTWHYSNDDSTCLVFREDGTLLVTSFYGGLVESTYAVTGEKIIIYLQTGKSEEVKYSYKDNQLYLDEETIPYIKTDEPAVFTATMDGQSMEDTIPEGTSLNFAIQDTSQIQRFDIVAVHYPDRGNTIFIKRIVGLPGEAVELRDGYLYINDVKFEEEYINDEYRSGKLNQFGPYTIPEGQYFILGDHRNNSNDSRSIGALDADKIIGILNIPPSMIIWTGHITGAHWERSIIIEKLITKSDSDWTLPEDATLIEQKEEIHHYDNVLDHYEEIEVQHSRQIIDHYETYYTYEDNSNGTFTEVPHERPVYTTEYYTATEQQPIYIQEPIYQTKYYYTIKEWQYSREETASGDDLKPEWPQTDLDTDEREGQKTQIYKLIVSDSQNNYTYRVNETYWRTVNLNDIINIVYRTYVHEWYVSDENGNYLSPAVQEN